THGPAGVLEERRRQPARHRREPPAEVAPGRRALEAAGAEGRRREREVRERPLAARALADREPLAEGEPAREALGPEGRPRRRGLTVVSLREQRRDRGEAVAGRQQRRVHRPAEPLGALMGRAPRGVARAGAPRPEAPTEAAG